MGRLRQSNIQIASQETGQYTNVKVNHFVIRRPNAHPLLVDSIMDEKIKNEVLEGFHDNLGIYFDCFSWKKKQIYGYVVGIFQKLKLLDVLKISEEKFLEFVIDIDRGYFDNPYHNFFHCVDVFHIVYYFLEFMDAGKWMSKLEMLAILIGSLCHDLAHPGVNNLYQVHARTKLSIMYNDISVIENYSCAMTFNLAAKHGLFRNLNQADYRSLRATIVQGLLATDMSCHFELLEKFKHFQKNFNPDEQQPTLDQKRLILNVILHAADISNPCRPWELCRKWSDMVVEEFYLQGDLEKLNGLPLSPNMDRDVHNQPSISTGFIDFLVKPFFEAIFTLLPKSTVFLDQLAHNRRAWQELKDNLDKQKDDPSASFLSNSIEILPGGARRLSVPPGTVTLPEDVFLKLSAESDQRASRDSINPLKSLSSSSRGDLPMVIESEQEGRRKGSLISKVDDDFEFPRRTDEKYQSTVSLKSKADGKRTKYFDNDRDYFNNLLVKNLHMNSEDMSLVQGKKTFSKGQQRTFHKAISLLELSSILLEIEKDVLLSGATDDSLLTIFFAEISELLARVFAASFVRIYLVDQAKFGGVALFSRGGYESPGGTTTAALTVEASNTPMGEVVRQAQPIFSFTAPNHSTLFPLVADSPPALEGAVVGVLDFKRPGHAFTPDEIKLLDSLSQILTPKLLMAYQQERLRK